MTTLQEIAINNIMTNLCKDLNKEIDNIILLLKNKKQELTKEELTNINIIAKKIVKEFQITIKNNIYILDIQKNNTSYSINTELKTRTLPTWLQPSNNVGSVRKKLLKHYEVRENYVNKLKAESKLLNNKKCIATAYDILKIIKDIKLKSSDP